jgi:hypothetical protein
MNTAMKTKCTQSLILSGLACGSLFGWLAATCGRSSGMAQAEDKPVASDQLDRTVLPIHEPAVAPITTLDAREAKAPPRFEVKAPQDAPNVVIVLIDDIGFGSSSAFGGPIKMPTLERLAASGLKYNRFHTTALCSPTRVALLTGHNHHANNAGAIMELATAFPGNTACGPGDHDAGRDPPPERIQHGGLRQIPRDAALGSLDLRVPTIAGPPARASTSSTASSVARPTSGPRRSSTVSRASSTSRSGTTTSPPT